MLFPEANKISVHISTV